MIPIILEKTDMGKFIELYQSFGIELTPETVADGFKITMEQGDNFRGYIGFFSVVYFNKKGRFTAQGFWE